ncbi:MAG: sugar ABC transporter ATP-binding protein [Thermacetogeniaceae bacterium]
MPKQDTDAPMLQLRDVSKIYPGTVALYKANLSVRRGEVHGIIGKNGAGKSTLVDIIAGIIEPTEGEIIVGDKKYTTLSRIAAKREQIAVVTQEPQVILDLTVAENLFLGDFGERRMIVNWQELYAKADQVIAKANLKIDARSKAGDLSMSERQLLLVLKACYVEDARIVMLDEASASLSQDDERLLHRIIAERKREGNTVIIISHRTDELLAVCDRVTVVRDGRTLGSQDCSRLNKETLSSLIVGEGFQLKDVFGGLDSTKVKSNQVLLSVENLTRVGAFQNISLTLRKGEILGLAGLRGSGRTEFLKGVAGIEPAEEGTVAIGNLKTRFSSPSQALKSGIVYLPEDREHEGLIKSLTVRDNLSLNALSRVSKRYIINKSSERKFTSDVVEALGIKVASIDQEVNQLSGGNKQKVVVGRISAAEPQVFLLDEPTRGVDISAKESILTIIKERLSAAAGVIITSPGLDDLMMICDRVLVLYKGKIISEFDRSEFNEGDLFLALQGGTKSQKAAG